MLNDQKLGKLSRSFQSNQPILNPNRERTERHVIRDDARTVQDGRRTSRSHEIDVTSFHEETVSSGRSGKPVVETNTDTVPDSSQTRSFHSTLETTLRERES